MHKFNIPGMFSLSVYVALLMQMWNCYSFTAFVCFYSSLCKSAVLRLKTNHMNPARTKKNKNKEV